MTTTLDGRACIDTIIKEAAERNELAGLTIRVPESATHDLAPQISVRGRSVVGTIATYNGVSLELTPRIKTYSQVEAYNDQKQKEKK